MSVRRTDEPFWKIYVCSRNKWTLLENYKKVAPGKKEQIFLKTVSVAASVQIDCTYFVALFSVIVSELQQSFSTSATQNETTLRKLINELVLLTIEKYGVKATPTTGKMRKKISFGSKIG